MKSFLKVEKWIIEFLENDYKTLGLYLYINNKLWWKVTSFIYSVNEREYTILAGQYATSLERLTKQLKIGRKTLLKSLKKLADIKAIQFEFLKHIHKNGKVSIDGLIITSLTAFDLPSKSATPPGQITDPPRLNNQAPTGQITDLSKNIFLSKNENERDLARARTRINNKTPNPPVNQPTPISESNNRNQINKPCSSQDRKNPPPEPLDDPDDIRFNLDQRFDPRVRQSVWRQLAVDWYFWATDNGRWRALHFTKFVDSVRAMIDSGQVDAETLREMYDKVVTVNVFWQRNFRRINKWNDYFSTGETRLKACLNDLNDLKEKSKNDKKNALTNSPYLENKYGHDDDFWEQKLREPLDLT